MVGSSIPATFLAMTPTAMRKCRIPSTSGLTPGRPTLPVVDVRPEFAGHAADMYLEGSDQHRGWVHVLADDFTAMKGKAPYRQVLTHGFTVDGQAAKCPSPSATPLARRT